MNPALIAAIPSILSTGAGIYQMIAGANKADTPRPEYQTPGQVLANQTLAAQEFGSGSQFASQMQLRGEMAAANALDVARNSGMGSSVVPAVVAQNQANARESLVAAEQKRGADLARLMMANTSVAQGRDLEFQMNQFAPYMQEYNEGREMVGAGATNVMNGVSGLSSLAQIYMNMQPPQTTQSVAASASSTTSNNAASGQSINNIVDDVTAWFRSNRPQ